VDEMEFCLFAFLFHKKNQNLFQGRMETEGLWDKFSFFSRYLEKVKQTTVRLLIDQQLTIRVDLRSVRLLMSTAVQA
jgi:hypothetical protein